MADIGFTIAELLATYFGEKVRNTKFYKIPLKAEDLEDTHIIANVGIHVEWVIGNLRKKYSTLNGTLPIDYLLPKGDGTEQLTTLNKIVHTACALINP